MTGEGLWQAKTEQGATSVTCLWFGYENSDNDQKIFQNVIKKIGFSNLDFSI